MYIEENSLDDLLYTLLKDFINLESTINNKKGENYEKLGAYIKLKNPRARVSATQTKNIAISPIGELIWYLSGSDKLDFIKYYIPNYVKYSDNNETINGAYGPRLIEMNGSINQIENIIELLQERKTSRRAVIQIFDAKDLLNFQHKDIPCTVSLQFLIRENKLHLFVNMRSNDVFLGLPHDIFCFTMIQEIIANKLNVDLGEYNHFVSSLHLYSKHKNIAKQYISEGLQSSKYIMPKMPSKNISENIKLLIIYEKKIRENPDFDISELPETESYWQDLIVLLKIYSLEKNQNRLQINTVKTLLKSDLFKQYVEEKFNLTSNE